MFETRPFTFRIAVIALAGAGLAGCSSLDSASSRVTSMVTPYKIDIVQGNVVTREQIAALKPGMPKEQVRDILGTALLASVFHADRWDYVFTLKSQGVAPQSRRVTVFFTKDGVVDRVQAEALPTEAEFVASLKSPVTNPKAPPMEATAETLSKYPLPSKSQPAVPPALVPTDYPPLEPVRR